MVTRDLRSFFPAVATFVCFSAASIWASASGSIWVFALAIVSGIICCETMLRAAGGIGLYLFWPRRYISLVQRQVAKLFDLASWEVRIMDSLSPNIYESPRVCEAIERAIARGVQIKVIVGVSEPHKQLLLRNPWLQKVSLWRIPDEISLRIIMVDGVHIEIGDKVDSKGHLLKGFCFYYQPRAIWYFNQLFERTLTKATAETA